MHFVRTALFGGTGAAIAATAAAAALSRLETGSSLRAINATSHFLWGETAGRTDRADLGHTLPGVAINAAAGFFWGTVFSAMRQRDGRSGTGPVLRDAALTALGAATLDYAILPRRLSPGWELALSRKSVGLSLAALALGLAAGGMVAERMERG